MKPRRTHFTNKVYRLVGGTEDNDLWTYENEDADGNSVVCSVWEPSAEERSAIADGDNVRLIVWGQQPAVAIDVTDEPLGKRPDSLDGPTDS